MSEPMHGNSKMYRKLKLSLEERLLLRVKKNEHGCWIISNDTNFRNSVGVSYFSNSKNKICSNSASRYVMMLIHGELTRDIIVCHKCDFGGCINPDHLYLGDAQTNSDDRKIPMKEKLEILKRGESLPWWKSQRC